jgi:hypothetical protein
MSSNTEQISRQLHCSFFMLGETSKPFFVCIVCGEHKPTSHNVKYRYDLKITQHNAANRHMVEAGREHCRQRHDDTWVWIILPECGTSVIEDHNEMSGESPFIYKRDYVIVT